MLISCRTLPAPAESWTSFSPSTARCVANASSLRRKSPVHINYWVAHLIDPPLHAALRGGFFHARRGRMVGMKQKPQISIRSLLLITAILAIAIGWLADRQRLRNQLHQAATKDLLQRQQISAMQQELQQFEANAARPVDYSWKFPALKNNFPATQSSAVQP